MKFTTEEAREKLMGILTNNGKKPLRMSSDSLNGQLETLLPIIANDEMELNDFVNKVQKSFEVMNSNAEHDNSVFVKQWMKEHTDAKHDEPKADKTKVSEDEKGNEKMEALLKRVEELEQSKKESEMKVRIGEKRNELLKAIEKKGIKNKDWSNAMVNMVSITDDMDVESEADNCLKLFNMQKSVGGDFTPLDSSGGKKDKDLLENVKKFRQQRGLNG